MATTIAKQFRATENIGLPSLITTLLFVVLFVIYATLRWTIESPAFEKPKKKP
ncbi:MAG: hypothetical protein QGD96_10990 [Anaerolineae bacterium]|nr:hypothetical protein [Anaerolineae bacterium]